MTEGRQQRRSGRISALDSWKLSALTHASGGPRGRCGRPPSSAGRPASGKGRKRGRKKRRLREVAEVAVSSVNGIGGEQEEEEDDVRDENNQRYERHQPDEEEKNEEKEGLSIDQDDDLGGTDRSRGAPSMPWIPDKKTLELILDILQKKDTHAIFAEPVDHEEVESYYEIIEEPMDFGTMRAKLQEGMYTTLEQFERDVFLIFSNAMHFNSSTTIYYRQARSIQELAKKTFHRLRTDPENFVLGHLSKKAKTGKVVKKVSTNCGNSAAQGESRISDIHSAARSSSPVKQRIATPNKASITADEKQGSLYTSLGSRRNKCSSSTVHGSNLLSDRRRDQEDDLFGCLTDGWKSCFSEEDRRSTYKYSDGSASGSDSLFSPLHGGPKNLAYVNRGDFGYVESLARFTADLGPTAQMVAARKIKKCKMLEAAKASASSSMYAKIMPENTTVSCTGSIAHSAAAENVSRVVTAAVQMGFLVPPTAAQLDSQKILVPPVSQTELLEIVSRNSSKGGNGDDANVCGIRPSYCHDDGTAWSAPTNVVPSNNIEAKLNQETGFAAGSKAFPHQPGLAPAPFLQMPRQCAVMDMSFVQSRLNCMSSCSNRQWQTSNNLTEPSVEMAVPSATDVWEQTGNQKSQSFPPSLPPISDCQQQPDLALQL